MNTKHPKNDTAIKLTRQTARRNFVAKHSQLQKGGVHDADNPRTVHKRARRASKKALNQRDWLRE